MCKTGRAQGPAVADTAQCGVGVIDMQVFCWILAAWLAVGALSTVASVGKPKQPLKGGTAAVIVLIVAAEVVGLALIATGVLR